MQRAAARMQALIDELLAFSRVTRAPARFAPVDLAAMARDVKVDLEARIASSGGSVVVGDLPTIDADATQMRQLLQNLIGNALKFRKPDEAPVVHVDASIVNGRAPACVLTVQDNGIGFDMKHAERIFAVFQRLHGRDEYEGTGVGLAICRRIAERHGGAIEASSAPGRGATFVVTLPVAQATQDSGVREARTDCIPAS
jgi:light-regulated signal transduction histidine kinase (bacteriophytochrome)